MLVDTLYHTILNLSNGIILYLLSFPPLPSSLWPPVLLSPFHPPPFHPPIPLLQVSVHWKRTLVEVSRYKFLLT